MPRATNAIALTPSLRLMKQPRWPATSPMTAVQAPMKAIEMTNVKYPLKIPVKEEACSKCFKMVTTGVLCRLQMAGYDM